VVLMGLAQRGAIAALLLARGWPAETPSAVLCGVSTASAHTWIGPLRELAGAALGDPDAAGTLVIGDVVALADEAASSAIAPLAAGGEK
jgi:siroheme synthase